jgi:hypothetical protein
MMLVAVGLVGAVGVAKAADVYPLDVASAAAYGASHVAVFSHADLTEDEAGVPQTNVTAFAVPANTYVEFVRAVLRVPFDTASTTDTNTVALTIGDGSDADLYLASMQLAVDDTEVYVQGPAVGALTSTAAFTFQRGTALDVNSTTNSLVITNVTAAITGTAALAGAKFYTSADTIDFLWTPGAGATLANQTEGEIWTYWRVVRQGTP